MSAYPFIPARLVTRRTSRKVTLLVIHTTECPQTHGAARGVASYFQGASAGGSAHYVVDDAEIIQCVRDNDVAAGAPFVNSRALHIEHVGHAAQTAADWQGDYSRKMLALSAELAAAKCQEHGIPIVRLSPSEVKNGAAGICGHFDVTQAYHRVGGHTDPGPAFPWNAYLFAIHGIDEMPLRVFVNGEEIEDAGGALREGVSYANMDRLKYSLGRNYGISGRFPLADLRQHSWSVEYDDRLKAVRLVGPMQPAGDSNG